jgi:hypothetical protein
MNRARLGGIAETFPLTEGYQRMMSGDARFRVVILPSVPAMDRVMSSRMAKILSTCRS